jgi:hypothetical protein
MRLFLKHATSRVCVVRSLKTSLAVGTVLALINHYDEIVRGTLSGTNVVQILVTYLVPYSVATFGAAMQARHMELARQREASR